MSTKRAELSDAVSCVAEALLCDEQPSRGAPEKRPHRPAWPATEGGAQRTPGTFLCSYSTTAADPGSIRPSWKPRNQRSGLQEARGDRTQGRQPDDLARTDQGSQFRSIRRTVRHLVAREASTIISPLSPASIARSEYRRPAPGVE